MADAENTAPEATEEGAAAPVVAKPKFKLNFKIKFSGLQLALISQLMLMIVGAILISMQIIAAKTPKFTNEALHERAIASLHNDISEIQLVELEPFMVNRIKNFTVRMSLQVEVSNIKTADMLRNRMPVVKAKILRILYAQERKDLTDTQGKLHLKEAIRETLNKELLEQGELVGVVRDVYFVDLVII